MAPRPELEAILIGPTGLSGPLSHESASLHVDGKEEACAVKRTLSFSTAIPPTLPCHQPAESS